MVFTLALPFSAFGIQLHKVEPLSTFEAHEAHNAGRSSTPVYIENEWQLAASAAQDAFGVSAR